MPALSPEGAARVPAICRHPAIKPLCLVITATTTLATAAFAPCNLQAFHGFWENQETIHTFLHQVARVERVEDFEALGEVAKQAVLYSTAYLYEHRENADYHQMTLMLRSLLFGVRKEGF